MASHTAGGSTRTNAYSGDDTLVAQTLGGTTTRYVQDLAAPLSQVLSSGGTNYIYGNERLYASTSGTKTWYGGDALGSVRQTLSNAGAVQSTINYDPWGQAQSGVVPTFGFTGEQQDGSLINLRARWYNSSRGAFTSRDPFAGNVEQPYSLHQYAYVLGNPVLLTDPSGQCQMEDDGVNCHKDPANQLDPRHSTVCPVGWSWGGPSQPECLRNSDYANLTITDGVPLDIGVVVGVSGSCGAGAGGSLGLEVVFDLYDLEMDTFAYGSAGGVIGGSATAYIGLVSGWSSYTNDKGVQNYKGYAGGLALNLGIGPLAVQGGVSSPDKDSGGRLWVGAVGAGASLGARFNGKVFEEVLGELGKIPGVPSGGLSYYFTAEDVGLPNTRKEFHAPGKRPTYNDAWRFISYLAKITGGTACGAGIAVPLGLVALYNGHAWQDAETIRRRHAQ